MILNQVQKKTIHMLSVDENHTIGGVALGEELRYEIHRVSEQEYKVGVYSLMICLDMDYVHSPDEVIEFIETH